MVKSYIIGFLGLFLSLLFIFTFKKYLNIKKTKSNKRLVLIYSLFGILCSGALFYLLKIFFPLNFSESSVLERVAFTLLLTPLAEEILFRRIIFQHLLNLEKIRFNVRSLLVGFGIYTSLILPSLILFSIGWIYEFDKLKLLMIFFLLIPFLFLFDKNKTPKNFYFIIVLISQTFIFLLSHGVYASKPLIATGLLYGILYFKSRSILPPLIAHYVHNLLIFFYTT
jgi:membrane protease YdiL (CAAX protease family)